MLPVKLAPTPEQRATPSDTLHRSIEGADRCSRLARDKLVHQDLKSSDSGARQRSARSRPSLTVCKFDNDTGRKLRVAGAQPYDADMLSSNDTWMAPIWAINRRRRDAAFVGADQDLAPTAKLHKGE